jgi:hypothetical protein
VLRSNNEVSLEIGVYDKTRRLVIDPWLSYSTYLGGSSIDVGRAIAVDSSGNAYIAGITSSGDFPVTPGAFQTTCSGCSGGAQHVFVTKFNPTGSALVYSTYLGGTNNDSGLGIALDTLGDAYVTGYTLSTDFPTTPGAFQTACAGSCAYQDAFVTELNPTGSALVYSTYLGGTGADVGQGIAVDASGDAYVTGDTLSSDFPATPGAFQTTCGGGPGNCTIGDGFVAKLTSDGSGLVYSTYLGGSSVDQALGIAVDASGNAYVTGGTSSSDFPTTPGAFETTCPAQDSCTPGAGFVTKLNSPGSALVYSTYLGGSHGGAGFGIVVDNSGDAYVTGTTDSTDFPVTPGASQTTFGGGETDAFVTKMNSSGSGLVYSTFLGGSGIDQGFGVALDSSDNSYVTGSTYSSDFPTTPGAFQTTCGGCSGTTADAFVTELNSAGSSLVYSTYLGGSNADGGQSIALGASGIAYVTGYTYSIDFPITPGAFQTKCGGGCSGTTYDAFVASFGPGVQVSPSGLGFGNQTVGIPSAPQTITLTNTVNATLTITSIGITGTDSEDFAESNACGNSLAPGVGCTISVTFTPTTTGTRTATVSITDSAPNSPQMVSLSGTGVQPAVTLSPTSLTFPDQVVFTTSKAKTVTLTNSGAGILNITGIATASPFLQRNTCGTSVAAGASCTISVSFRPITKGTVTGSLSITDNAPASPQKVTLTGTGTYIQLSPASLNFGNQPVGTKSLSKKITVSNKGGTTVSLTSISIGGTDAGDFAETNTCGTSLASGASCFITVTFTPLATGKRTAAVLVKDNGGGSPQEVPLLGTGTP